MGLLDNFEKGLERAVNGAFAKTFRSGLQPVEITAALRREIDTKAAVVSRDRMLVPNKFAVRMSPTDHDRMAGLGPALIDELDRPRAEARGEPALPVRRRHLDRAPARRRASPTGMVQVDSRNVKGQVAWTPVLDIDGKRYPIAQGPHGHRPRQRRRHHPRRLRRLAASTSRSCGTARAPGCATSAPRTAPS